MSCSASALVIGARPVIEATFRDEDNVLADPTGITVVTRAPDGTKTTYATPSGTIAQESTGVWRFTFPAPLTEVGKWYVGVTGTGSVEGSSETSFQLRSTHTAS